MFVRGLAVALLDSTIPVFIGRVVTLLSTEKPATLLARRLAAARRRSAVVC